jgi:hypothetical protein
MNFEHFGFARDLLYLAALLTGTCVALFLIMIQKTNTPYRRSVCISVIFCLASLAVASLAGAIILSRGLVFTVASLYPFVVLFLAMGILGVRFPRAGGCTVIFVTGLVAVWICFSFLAYPRFEELSLRASGDGQLLIRKRVHTQEPAQGPAGSFRAGGFIWRGTDGISGSRSPTAPDDETWNVKDDGGALFFEALSVTAYPGYPLIGGERRGIITNAGRNNEVFFSVKRFRAFGPGFMVNRYSLELPSGAMLPGMNLSVLFDGEKLYFDPAIQF